MEQWQRASKARDKMRAAMLAYYTVLRETNNHSEARQQMEYDAQLLYRELKARVG